MPHERAKLADADIAKIAEWIDLGAPYDKPFVDKDDAAWTRKVIAAGREEALGVPAALREVRKPPTARLETRSTRFLLGEAREGRADAEPAGRQARRSSAACTST